MVPNEPLELRVQQVLKVLLVHKVLQDPQELKVKLVILVHKVLQDPQELKVLQDPQVLKVLKDLQHQHHNSLLSELELVQQRLSL